MCYYCNVKASRLQPPHHADNMIQRSLLSQSRALCSRSYHPSRSVISRYSHHPLRIPPPPTKRTSRCYSTATETEGGARVEAPVPEADSEDPAKKELEEKNKEIIELKVRRQLIYHDQHQNAHLISVLG